MFEFQHKDKHDETAICIPAALCIVSVLYQRTTHQIYVHKNPFCVVNFNIIADLPIIMKLKGKHNLYYLEHL